MIMNAFSIVAGMVPMLLTFDNQYSVQTYANLLFNLFIPTDASQINTHSPLPILPQLLSPNLPLHLTNSPRPN